jgi:ubiquinone/menaquinone biosynthesis C-methylase UbiE
MLKTKDKYSLEQIRDFWTEQAKEHGQSYQASWSDQNAIDLEIREIASRLQDGDKVLDIGCANGYSTLHFAADKKLQIRGLDYIPEMIEAAQTSLSQCASRLKSTVEFAVGDITSLKEVEQAYDKAVVIRVLINLETWENQKAALRQCIKVLKPGGTLLLSEATVQGWQKLNSMRKEWDLPQIPMPAFNQYLDEEKVIDYVSSDLELKELVNFSSTYFVLTRIVKPLLAKASNIGMDAAANPAMEWNRFAGLLPAAGDYGTQKLFVFQKRS